MIIDTLTFIATLGTGAFTASWLIYGAMGVEAFAAHVELVLITELEPGTVVNLDNRASHKNAAAVKAMRKAAYLSSF